MKITFLIGHMVKERDLILHELAEDLGRHGAEVTVISGYPSRRITNEVREYYLSHPVEKIGDRVTSIRVGSKKGEGNGLFQRMIKYLLLSKAIVDKAMTVDTDVFYIYSTPPFLAYYAGRLRKKAPVVYNAQDLFPDSLKTAKNLSENNVLIKILRRFEKKVYKNCDSIITISDDMKDHIIENGAILQKVTVINNWADTESIVPTSKSNNSLFEEFGIKRDRFTVLYAGDIGLHQRLDVFFNVATILNNLDENIQFIFFGNGVYEPTLKRKIKENKLKNFSVFPLQPVNRISEVYGVGDIDIVSLEKGMTKLALPSKLWSVMSAGRPVLSVFDKESRIAKMIDGRFGFNVDGYTENEIASLIIELKNKPDILSEMGRTARIEMECNNTRFSQTKKYYDTMSNIVTKCDS